MTALPIATNQSGYNVLIYLQLRSWLTTEGLVYDAFKWGIRGAAVESDLPGHRGYYQPVITDMSENARMGRLSDGNIVWPELSFSIARTSADQAGRVTTDVVSRIRDFGFLIGYEVRAYRVKAGDSKPNAGNLFFVGHVNRGGVSITKDSVKFTCSNRMKQDDRPLLREELTLDDYPYISDWKGKKVPVLFGKFGRTASEYYEVEAPVIMADNERGNIQCKLCTPGADGIGSCGTYARWVDSSGNVKGITAGDNLPILEGSDGVFFVSYTLASSFVTRLDPAQAADPNNYLFRQGDKIIVRSPRGNLDGSTTLEDPVDIIEFLLTDTEIGLGLSSDDLDVFSFGIANIRTNSYQFKTALRVTQDITVLRAIEKICGEFGLKLLVVNGLYTLKYLGFETLSDPDWTINRDFIVASGGSVWEDTADAGRDGFDAVEIQYHQNKDGETTRIIRTADPGTHPADVTKVIESECISDDDTASIVMALFAVNHSGALRTVKATFDFNAAPIQLGDVVEIDYHAELDGIYIVTDVTRNHLSATSDLTMVALSSSGIGGVWADEEGEACPAAFGGGFVPASWTDATDEQRQALSFWINDDTDTNEDGTTPGKVWTR